MSPPLPVMDNGSRQLSETNKRNNVTDNGSAHMSLTKKGNYDHLRGQRLKFDVEPITDYSKRMRHAYGVKQRSEASIKSDHDLNGEGNCCHKRQCIECGFVFYAATTTAKYCSYRCRNDASIKRKTIRREQARQRMCKHCKSLFASVRKDTKYCSPSCKQAAYRERVIEAEIKRAEGWRILQGYNNALHGGRG